MNNACPLFGRYTVMYFLEMKIKLKVVEEMMSRVSTVSPTAKTTDWEQLN